MHNTSKQWFLSAYNVIFVDKCFCQRTCNLVPVGASECAIKAFVTGEEK